MTIFRKNKKSGNKKTIGYFITQLHDHYQSMISPGIVDCAKDKGCNLIAFVGKSLNSTSKIDNQEHVIFNLANKYNIDGLLIVTASIGNYLTPEELQLFCNKFKPLPIVCLSTPVEGFPSITCANEIGMHEIASHFIKDHQYKRIAFISGPAHNPESQIRFQTFKEVLSENNVPFFPELYYEGKFILSSGIKAIKTLIDDRKTPFDAVLAANDEMAIGAYRELIKRGIRVPDEVAIGGFDNVTKTKILKPQITTVSQQLYNESYKAVEVLIDCIEKKEVKQEYIFPAKLIIRQSCGCNSGHTFKKHSYSADRQNVQKGISISESQTQSIIQQVMSDFELELENPRAIHQFKPLVPQFIYAFFHDFQNSMDNTFIEEIEKINMAADMQDNFLFFIKEIITKLYHKSNNLFNTSPQLSTRAFDLYHKINNQVNDLIISNAQNESIKKSDYNFSMLQETKKLSITYELARVKDIISDLMYSFNINFCFIALYENTGDHALYPSQNARTFVHYQADKGTLTDNNELFETKYIVPKKVLPSLNKGNYAIFPLVSEYDQFGYIIFDYTLEKDPIFYETLQGHISTSIKSAILFEKNQNQKDELNIVINKLRSIMGGFINSMSLLVEARDPYTAGHQMRVADLARAIAAKMDFTDERIEGIRVAGALHDLGKLYLPGQILNKPGKLVPIEFDLIKIHPQVAYNILKSVDFTWPVADIVLQHHERLNGSGYPAGLKDGDIMIEAQILAVADVVEAMMSHRPYRQALGLETTLDEIIKNKNSLYNPQIVDCCVSLLTEDNFQFKKYTNSFQDQ